MVTSIASRDLISQAKFFFHHIQNLKLNLIKKINKKKKLAKDKILQMTYMIKINGLQIVDFLLM